jgi:hypothetical protein
MIKIILLENRSEVIIANNSSISFNPYPAKVDNMASSYQCWQIADGI